MKYFALMILFSFSVFSASQVENKLFAVKMSFETQAYDLKVQLEQELINALGKKDFNFNSGEKSSNLSILDTSCIEWVYQGPASREEAARACAGVQGTDCIKWVYQGPASRVEAAESCKGVTDMECVEFVYRGSATRVQAAQSCQDGRHRPRDPRDC